MRNVTTRRTLRQGSPVRQSSCSEATMGLFALRHGGRAAAGVGRPAQLVGKENDHGWFDSLGRLSLGPLLRGGKTSTSGSGASLGQLPVRDEVGGEALTRGDW